MDPRVSPGFLDVSGRRTFLGVSMGFRFSRTFPMVFLWFFRVVFHDFIVTSKCSMVLEWFCSRFLDNYTNVFKALFFGAFPLRESGHQLIKQ